MRRPIFFTGTGTDIGKTHVLCELLKVYREAGGKARVLKPVVSGFDPDNLNATDTIRLMRANGEDLTGAGVKAVTPWRFREPLSPDMAARRENRDLLIDDIVNWCLDRLDPRQPTLIEGAGGIMSPIAEDGLNIDLMRELDAVPVLVAGNYLGTISHTLTALRVLDGRAIVVINEIEAGPVPVDETISTLRRYAPRASILLHDPRKPEALLSILDQARQQD